MRRVLIAAALLVATRLPAQVGSMRVTVPSPTAASLGKFGAVPVSLYTGTPDITIPLFTAQGKTLALPIVLKYHPEGIRVGDIGSWIGLGWTLEAGGVITRTVRGLLDESFYGYYNSGYVFYADGNWPGVPTTILDKIREEQLDGEPDRFFFSFAGRSGQFVMGPTSTSPTLKEVRTIPHQRLRIQPTIGATHTITSFVITTEDGTRYTFGASEVTGDVSTTDPPGATGTSGNHSDESHSSSWHLTGVRSAGGDTITLSYVSYVARHRMGSYREEFSDIVHAPDVACVPPYYAVTSEFEILTQRLVSITTANHTITFTPGSTLRLDARSPSGAQQEPFLDKITVATPAGTVLRIFQFGHDYFPGNRLRLASVSEQDRNDVSLPPHTFTYDGQTLPPRTSYAQDHWGFYNGANTNEKLIPTVVRPNGIIEPGADRRPDATAMKVGVLTKITYPTGGSTEFIYEANDYGGGTDDGPQQNTAIGSWPGQGLRTTTFTVGGVETAVTRVHLSISGPDFGVSCSRTRGDVNECPFGEIVGKGRWYDPADWYVTLAPGTYTLQASSGPYNVSASIDVAWRDRVVVTKKLGGGLRVAEVRDSNAMGNVTVHRYQYTLQSDPTTSSGVVGGEPLYTHQYHSNACTYFSRAAGSKLALSGPSVGYSEVTVLDGTNGEYGKTRHTFRFGPADPLPPHALWPFSTRTTYDWLRGQELESFEYKTSGEVQRRLGSTYTVRDDPAADPDAVRRFRGVSIHVFSAGRWAGYLQQNEYYYGPFEVISAWTYKDAETTTVYDTTGTSSFSTATTFVYGNPKHLQLTEVTETNSDGTQRVTRMKYPADYPTGTGNPEAAALTSMQGSAHIHSPIIERWVIKRVGTTNSVVQGEITTFREFGLGQYLPYQHFVLNNPTPLP